MSPQRWTPIQRVQGHGFDSLEQTKNHRTLPIMRLPETEGRADNSGEYTGDLGRVSRHGEPDRTSRAKAQEGHDRVGMRYDALAQRSTAGEVETKDILQRTARMVSDATGLMLKRRDLSPEQEPEIWFQRIHQADEKAAKDRAVPVRESDASLQTTSLITPPNGRQTSLISKAPQRQRNPSRAGSVRQRMTTPKSRQMLARLPGILRAVNILRKPANIVRGESLPSGGGLRWRASELLRRSPTSQIPWSTSLWRVRRIGRSENSTPVRPVHSIHPVQMKQRTMERVGLVRDTLYSHELPTGHVTSSESWQFESPAIFQPAPNRNDFSSTHQIRNQESAGHSRKSNPDGPIQRPVSFNESRKGLLRHTGRLMPGGRALVLRGRDMGVKPKLGTKPGRGRRPVVGSRPDVGSMPAVASMLSAGSMPSVGSMNEQVAPFNSGTASGKTGNPEAHSQLQRVIARPKDSRLDSAVPSGAAVLNHKLLRRFRELHEDSVPFAIANGQSRIPFAATSESIPRASRLLPRAEISRMVSMKGIRKKAEVNQSTMSAKNSGVLQRKSSLAPDNATHRGEESIASLLDFRESPAQAPDLQLASMGQRSRQVGDSPPSMAEFLSPHAGKASGSGAGGGSRVFRRVSATPSTSFGTVQRVPAPDGLAPPATVGASTASAGSGVILEDGPGKSSGNVNRDVTDFEAWEIEFLSAKVYSYIKRKLDVEMERHGRLRSNPWI